MMRFVAAKRLVAIGALLSACLVPFTAQGRSTREQVRFYRALTALGVPRPIVRTLQKHRKLPKSKCRSEFQGPAAVFSRRVSSRGSRKIVYFVIQNHDKDKGAGTSIAVATPDFG